MTVQREVMAVDQDSKPRLSVFSKVILYSMSHFDIEELSIRPEKTNSLRKYVSLLKRLIGFYVAVTKCKRSVFK